MTGTSTIVVTRIRDAEIAPFDPVASSKVIGDGEGGSPEARSPTGTMITAIRTNRMASRRLMRWNGDLMNRRIPAAVENSISRHRRASHVQRIERRPMRLLRGEEVTAMRRPACRPTSAAWGRAAEWKRGSRAGKEKRHLAVGKTQHPGGSCRRVMAAGAGRQDLQHHANGQASLLTGRTARRDVPACHPSWLAEVPRQRFLKSSAALFMQ